MSLHNARVLVVTGKGGVGKTTLTAALALRQARQGKRILVAEFGGAARIPALFGLESSSYEPQQLGENLYALSLTPEAAIEDFVVLRLKLRSLYRLVFDNRMMRPFLAAVPGLHDLVQLGKLYYEEALQEPDGTPKWDQIILDGPATGHGINMLHAPRSMMDLTVAGPFHENAKLVHTVFSDPERCQIVVAALPQDLVVNETQELAHQLGEYRAQLGLCILNEVEPKPFAELSWWKTVRPHLAGHGLEESLACVDREVNRAIQAQEARRRLETNLGVEVLDLPHLETDEMGLEEIGTLAELLESSL
ncbi:MAG: ArsA family ATPase [Myxococcota bacterium]|nr:ArsA family ATPase [Myxococcota bacterium]